VNFIWGMVGAMITPMILSFTTADRLGAIITLAGTVMFTGCLLMTAWGGPKRRIYGVLVFELLSGFCFMLMGLRPDFWLIAAGAFGTHITIAIVFGSNQALWQTKVEPENQGRVFAPQQMIASSVSPLAYIVAGPLAERVFEPLLAESGALVPTFGQLIGVGAGRGIGMMFVLMGVAKVVVSLLGYLNPRVRLLEVELPDALQDNPMREIRKP
jgi:DHA3 family macrolide efflux protein-like MFS transporter